MTKKSWHEAALRQGRVSHITKKFQKKMFVPLHFFQAREGRVFKIQENLCGVLSQIAWRLRCSDKRRHANIRRRSEAQHCSSLCSQSEGDEYCGGPARAGKPNKSTAPGHHTSYPTSYLSGRVFKIQKNLCAVLSQTTSGKACAHDKRTKCEKERPERAASS